MGDQKIQVGTDSKMGSFLLHEVKPMCEFISGRPRKQKVTKLGSRKLHFPKLTKKWSIFGDRIDYNGVGVLGRQSHIPSKN